MVNVHAPAEEAPKRMVALTKSGCRRPNSLIICVRVSRRERPPSDLSGYSGGQDGQVQAQPAVPTLVACAILGAAAMTPCNTRALTLPQLVGLTIFRLHPLQEDIASYEDVA